MNWLSWLIYLSEVSNSISGFFTAVSVIFGAMLVMLGFAWVITEGESNAITQYWGRLISGTIVFGFLACLLPSQKTVLMIAGSEATASLAATPEAKEMLGDLKDVIQGRLRELKSSSEKK